MRLSESLRRNIFDSFVGGIINRFKIKSRRNVLIFEDILAQYIKMCEDAGYKKEMESIGSYWGALTIEAFLPAAFRKLPLTAVANTIGMTVWRNVGLLDYMNASQETNTATLETRNEYITRIIGENRFLVGKYGAILSVLTGKSVKLIRTSQSAKKSVYAFEIKNEPMICIEYKGRKKYGELNQKFFDAGYALKDVLKMKVFRIRDNKLIFREHTIIPIENTLFAIIGDKSIMLDEVAEISCNFFKKVIMTEDIEEALPFLKRLMQVMGWGRFRIIFKSESEIYFEIENMPYGLQKEPDNWNFLAFMLLGYLRAFNKDFCICKKEFGKTVKLEFRS